MRIAIAATPFMLPLMFQLAFGLSALDAGLMVLVYMAGNLLMKTVTTPLLRWFGFRNVLVVNGILSAAAIPACGLLQPGASKPGGLGGAVRRRGVPLDELHRHQHAGLRRRGPGSRSAATALWGVAQQICFSLGVAVAAVLLNLSLTVRNAPALALIDFRYVFAAMARRGAGLGAVVRHPGPRRRPGGQRPSAQGGRSVARLRLRRDVSVRRVTFRWTSAFGPATIGR